MPSRARSSVACVGIVLLALVACGAAAAQDLTLTAPDGSVEVVVDVSSNSTFGTLKRVQPPGQVLCNTRDFTVVYFVHTTVDDDMPRTSLPPDYDDPAVPSWQEGILQGDKSSIPIWSSSWVTTETSSAPIVVTSQDDNGRTVSYEHTASQAVLRWDDVKIRLEDQDEDTETVLASVAVTLEVIAVNGTGTS